MTPSRLHSKRDCCLNRILTFLYLASPGILEHYDISLDTIPSQTQVLTVETGELWLDPIGPELVTNSEQLTPGYTSLPGSFITPSTLSQRGWESARAAWLIETASAITDDQVGMARDLEADAGITIEARDDRADLVALRTGATIAGILVVLGILATTVGLIRSEGEGDIRTLTATGATSNVRRTLTAAAAGALALLGAVLGTAGAYLGFVAGHSSELAALRPVPFLQLGGIVIGLPLLAIVAGWLFAGREPGILARQPIE